MKQTNISFEKQKIDLSFIYTDATQLTNFTRAVDARTNLTQYTPHFTDYLLNCTLS